jgi:hypothetical protein
MKDTCLIDDKKLEVAFYRSKAGAEPVLEWLRELPSEDRQTLGRDLRLVEMGWPIGMPLCKPLGSSQQTHEPQDCPCHLLCFAGLYGSAARLHQKDAENSAIGTGFGPSAAKGG